MEGSFIKKGISVSTELGSQLRPHLPNTISPHDKGKVGEVRGLIKLENPFLILFERFCIFLLSRLYTYHHGTLYRQ